MSDSDLKEREGDVGEHDDLGVHPERREAEAEELENLYNNSASEADEDDEQDSEPEDQAAAQNSGLFRQEGKKTAIKSNKKLKRGLMFGGPTLIVIIFFIVLLLLTGALKAIHFSTVIRSVGFASSQNIMRKSFNEIAYSEWATDANTVELPKSKLREKIFSDDMRKVQRQLADEGKFKYTKDAKGNIDGFEVNGERVVFDDIAKKMGKNSWDELTAREKLTGRKYQTDKVKFEMADVFDMETRSFRNGFWKGFREATGIKMSFFRDIVRDKAGTGTIDESKNNDNARTADEHAGISEGGGTQSGLPETEEGRQEVGKIIDEGAKKGIRIKGREALNTYLEGKGSSLVAFEEGMAKASEAVLITTLYCIGHDMAGTSDRINQQMELSMARFGHQQQTAPDQTKYGNVTSGDVAFVSREWGGDDKTPDAAAAPLYQQAVGNEVSNADLSNVPRMNMSLPLIDWLKPIDESIRTYISGGANKLPLIGNTIDEKLNGVITAGCGVVMNPGVQAGVLVVDIVGTIFSAGTLKAALKSLTTSVLYFAGFAGVGYIIQSYINQLAGTGITGTEVGADKYNAAAVSTDYLNSQTGRGTTFAAPESSSEASNTKTLAMAELRDHYKSSTAKERYLAITNPTSLLGLAVAKIPTSAHSVGSALATLTSSLGTIFSRTFGVFGWAMSGAKAHAANEKDLYYANDYFGVNQWGWTSDEQNTLSETNVLDNAALVESRMKSDPSYYNGLQQCYAPNRLLYEIAKDPKCKAQSKGAPEPLRDPRALQWRIYKLHEFTVNQLNSQGLNET